MALSSSAAAVAFTKNLWDSNATTISRLPVTAKGGVASAAPVLKKILLGRLESHATLHLRNIKGDIYEGGTVPSERRFSFRVTAAPRPETWANVSSAEARELRQQGGIYLVIWNPPDQRRNRTLITFSVPVDTPGFFDALEPDQQYVKLYVKPMDNGYKAVLKQESRHELTLDLKGEWVAEIKLADWEAEWLQDLKPATDSVTRAMQSQGYERSPAVRKAIEQHAMGIAIKFFKDDGYEVKDVHKKRPYDLEISKNGESTRVEVKGTRTTGEVVLLTAGEVKSASNPKHRSRLFVVHSVRVLRQEKILVEGGIVAHVNPWQPKRKDLRPIAYAYQVPKIS